MTQFGDMALIALGSNKKSPWGDPTETVNRALELLEMLAQAPVLRSQLYVTPAFPADAGPDFVNAAAAFKTDRAPKEILKALHQIEKEASRTRDARWVERTLDLDLLAVGEQVLPDAEAHAFWRNLSLTEQQETAPPELILPHPRLQDRAFVLVPLADVAPHWRHPLLGATVQEMLLACAADDVGAVRPLQPSQ
ncbi:2-amino-4-hydroxy-6-hydroxymethyldihydropteridine diphosphokinase [Cognatiyoonia sp. IB215446]|uniref:2-amino-4-hydroxy-6- hydroxymethyldihydropteridine diphosphokinase n=1 Tax=Cognatiyoonia sp. IB215446 TaxID=3097355 RepID=UPI002A153370|nr:2-amino-4-hydroxy-6-hydroxymethyldihydropteridine diphosphokinase [Cognatiyoonia sp. IB215446]MDX8350318.1 2-amino-4-hydroxy-6-hydroxymethyldihydropteridine diphosphokinase [Cognatiyoonia sp. IB215446]